jgi:hypothetical protein
MLSFRNGNWSRPARAALAADLQSPLAVPRGHELERLVRRVLDPGPFDERIEVRDVDEPGSVPVGGRGDRARQRFLSELAADRDDLIRLHVCAEADGELRQPLQAPVHDADSTRRTRA